MTSLSTRESRFEIAGHIGILGFDGKPAGGPMHRASGLLHAVRHVCRDLMSAMKPKRRHSETLFGGRRRLVVFPFARASLISCSASRWSRMLDEGVFDKLCRHVHQNARVGQRGTVVLVAMMSLMLGNRHAGCRKDGCRDRSGDKRIAHAGSVEVDLVVAS